MTADVGREHPIDNGIDALVPLVHRDVDEDVGHVHLEDAEEDVEVVVLKHRSGRRM